MRYLLIFFIQITFLFAGVSSKYESGLALFKEKKYDKAYREFEKALYKDFSNPKISFYIGRSAYELGLYEEAMLAYERVLILDPNSLRTRLELARTCIVLKIDARAKQELNKVLEANPPKTLRANVHKVLKFLEQKNKNSFWRYGLSFGIGYDDNVNANPGEDVLRDYLVTTINTININNLGIIPDKASTRYAQELFTLQNLYKFKESDFFIENSFLLYLQQYDNYSQYNLGYLSLTTAPGRVYKGYKFTLPLNYSKIYYGGEKLFDLKSVQLKVEKKLLKTTVANIACKYEDKSYDKQSYKNRDTHIKSVELGVAHKTGQGLYQIAYLHNQEDKTYATSQQFVDRKLDRFNLMYATNLFEQLILNAQLSYKRYKYNDTVSLEKRVDETFTSYVALTKKIKQSLSATLEYRNINNNSNYTPVIYEKNSYGVKLNLSF